MKSRAGEQHAWWEIPAGHHSTAEEGGRTELDGLPVLHRPRLHPMPALSHQGTAGNSQTLVKTEVFCERSSSPHRFLTAVQSCSC